jgi:hypothetical protein
MVLDYKATNSVSYRPVPLTNFRTISMVMETSASAVAVVTKQSKDLTSCWGCPLWRCMECCEWIEGHCDECCQNKWQATTKSGVKNDRCETQ